ncbi:magnesium transporter, partial [Escherichia coli]|nr:magnesium transporter [Escherichia coli]
MSMNTDEKERVQEELYDQTLLDQYLENDDIDQFRDEFLALHTYEQSEYFEDT